MALTIPTTQQQTDQNLANLESKLGQTSPINDKAFLRVLAAMEAICNTGLYKYAAERAKQNLTLTATGADLDRLGNEYNTPRKLAATAVITATLPATDGTIIPAGRPFSCSVNGLLYYNDASAEATGGVATLSLTAEQSGTIGNLQIGDTMIIVSPIAGAENTATVTGSTTTGAEAETDEAYRPRVQFAMRASTGGANATDHKIWAEGVAGVLRAFPFAGKPVDSLLDSYPGDRTVYVEADTTLDPNGVAPTSLLDSVRAALLIDPDTGLSRPTLGLTDSTLYVESITRDSVDITITNLTTPTGLDATVKADISDALDQYFSDLVCYVEGVDLEQDRNDQITTLTIGQVIQEVLDTSGSSAETVEFEISATGYDFYQLSPGELVKTGTITYAVI